MATLAKKVPDPCTKAMMMATVNNESVTRITYLTKKSACL